MPEKFNYITKKDADKIKNTRQISDFQEQDNFNPDAPLIIDYSLEDSYGFRRRQPSKLVHFLRAVKAYFNDLLSEEKAFGNQFIFGTLFALMGCLFYYYLSFTLTFKAIGYMILGLCFVRLIFHKFYICLLFCYFAMFFMFGILCAKFEDWRLSTPMLAQEETSFIKGKVLEIYKKNNGQFSLVVKLLSTKDPEIRVPLKRVKLSIRQKIDAPQRNDTIQGLVKLYPLSGPAYPQGYDLAFYNYFQGIGAQGFFMSKPIFEHQETNLNFIKRLGLTIETLRTIIDKRIRLALPSQEGAIASALITGKRENIQESTYQAYRLSGLAHILSISGLHMSIVTGLVFIGLRKLFVFFPFFSSHYPIKKITAFFALLIATFYLFIAGAGISVSRSYVMIAIMLIAVLFDQPAISMRNLAFSIFVVLLFYPHQILNPAFQMSYSATAALISTFTLWSRYREKIDYYQSQIVFVGSDFLKKILKPISTVIFVSLIAGFATGFFSAYHFFNLAPLGFVSNLLAMPIMSFIVMPFAVIAIFLMLFQLEYWPLQIMGVGLNFIQKIAIMVTNLTPDMALKLFPALALFCFSLGLMALFCFSTKLRLISLVFFMMGLFLCYQNKKPLLLISENGQYAGLFVQERLLSLNNTRLPAFLSQSWSRAFAIKEMIKPSKLDQKDTVTDRFILDPYFTINKSKEVVGFLNIPEAVDALRFLNLNQKSGILILNYSTYRQNLTAFCKKFPQYLIITQKDLARKGAVLIYQDKTTQWAVGVPERNWNLYRQYSRAGRGF